MSAPEITEPVEAEEAPTVAQPRTGEEFVAEIDAAIDAKVELDRKRDESGEPAEPEAEPERSFDTLVNVQSQMLRRGEVERVAMPNELQGVDLNEPGEVRARLLELQSDEDERAALARAQVASQESKLHSEAKSEQVYSQALSVLESGSSADVYEAATLLQEKSPEVFKAFHREWSVLDPEGAIAWGQSHPPIDWAAREAEAAATIERAEANVAQREAQERFEELAGAFHERKEALLADPKTARYVEPALNLIQAQGENVPGPQSPEEAQRYLDATVRTVRETFRTGQKARQEAKMLLGVDEALWRQEQFENADVDLPSWDEGEALERLADERFAEIGLKGPKPSATESFLAEFDRSLEEMNLTGEEKFALPKAITDRIEEQHKARLRLRHPRINL